MGRVAAYLAVAGLAGGRADRPAFLRDSEFERLSRLVRAGRDLDTTGQAISVLGATNNLFSDDPHFDYSVATRSASVPGSPPIACPGARVHLVGEDAIRRFQEFMRVGGELELEDVRMEWEQQPKHVAEFLGTEADEGTLLLRAEPVLPPRSMRIQFATTTGDVGVDFDMAPTAPSTGWDVALVGQRGGTEMRMFLRRRGEGRDELELVVAHGRDVIRRRAFDRAKILEAGRR